MWRVKEDEGRLGERDVCGRVDKLMISDTQNYVPTFSLKSRAYTSSVGVRFSVLLDTYYTVGRSSFISFMHVGRFN